jgi:hypothetical protein
LVEPARGRRALIAQFKKSSFPIDVRNVFTGGQVAELRFALSLPDLHHYGDL